MFLQYNTIASLDFVFPTNVHRVTDLPTTDECQHLTSYKVRFLSIKNP